MLKRYAVVTCKDATKAEWFWTLQDAKDRRTEILNETTLNECDVEIGIWAKIY